jgi:tetratricopeptide (TPR) repeat protein
MVAESVPDAKGKWKEIVKPGDYTVKAVCDGYLPAQKSVPVLENKSRVVVLAIRVLTQAEVKAAAQAAAGPQVKTVAIPVVVSAGAGGARPSSPASAPSSPAPASAPSQGQSKAALAEQEFQLAQQLYNQGKYQDAVDALIRAKDYDPTNGRYYARAILIDINNLKNKVDAKDLRDEGLKRAKKNVEELKQAILEIPG